MNSPNHYQLEQIGRFLTDEKRVLQGIGPDVYEQNLAIVNELNRVTDDLADSDLLLSAQIIGSRVHGASDMGSDLDLVLVSLDPEGEGAYIDFRFNQELNARLNCIEVDTAWAAEVCDLGTKVPVEPDEFMHWVEASPLEATSLFEEGVRSTVSRSFVALAAANVLCSSKEGIWSLIRAQHARVYLGDQGRVREKLQSRLLQTAEAIARVVTPSLMGMRVTNFGLPLTLKEQYALLETAMIQQNPSDSLAYELCRKVAEKTKMSKSLTLA